MRLKQKLIKYLVRTIKRLGAERLLLNTPLTFLNTRNWIERNAHGILSSYTVLEPAISITENPPIVIGHPVSKRFSRNYERVAYEGYVAKIPGARVLGEFSNFIIAPDNILLSDVSREFGAEGGRSPEDFSIFHNRLRMPPCVKQAGNIAVISTSGSNNFHHWNYDVLPRLDLLSRAGYIKNIDKFIINNSGLKFQLEGLSKFDIKPEQIINPKGRQQFYLEAENLFIPSLPEDLGTISPWVIRFLRDLFLRNGDKSTTEKKLFLSRQNAPSRRIVNNEEVLCEIMASGFVEYTPENFSMEEVATHFSAVDSIISVHGSGLSNLPFISEGTKVLDILAPYHQDPYYWMICNQRKSKYVALFAEGAHPSDDLDLVKNKVDADLIIDLDKLKAALREIT
jgi:hypothetical protein